jgi:cell division protein FtsW (lipid II flippase)
MSTGMAIGFSACAVAVFLLSKARLRMLIGFVAILLFVALIIVMPITSQSECKEEKPSLTGTIWRWQRSLYSNDAENIPADPDQYTLTLNPD